MRKVIVGGIRYKRRTKKRPATIQFERGKELGRGGEGIVYEGKATVANSRGRKITIPVALKYFNAWFSVEYALKNIIVPQYLIVRELQELERVHKLGLHVLPTYRFVMNRGERPFVVKTLLPSEKKLTLEQRDQFRRDEEKQIKILEKYGFYEEYQHLSFHPCLLSDGRVIAVLNDMGNVIRKRRNLE